MLRGRNGEEPGVDDSERRIAERRLLVLAPTANEAAQTRHDFEHAGMTCLCVPDLPALCDEMSKGVAAIVIPEECVSLERRDCLSEWLANQEAWSDLPVLVLALQGADSAAVARAMDQLGNVTVLERPTRAAALVSAARSALRARQRQYQIRESMVERERVAEALIASDRRKDEFLDLLAHELRNPLAPIVNSLRLLDLTVGNDPRIARIREMLSRQVGCMVRLVDDLLEISRITRGRIELRKEAVALSDIVQSAVDSIRPAADAAGHTLSVSLPDQSLLLEGDPARLVQVLSNVLHNAVKYTAPRGRIWITAELEEDRVAIRVRDTGCGIPMEMVPRVFDLFTQVPQETAPSQGGLGVGLTLVQRLVELHGGSVSAFSEGRDRGSEFTIRLPLPVLRFDFESGAMRGEAPTPQLSRRRVLVVDDNHDAADSLASLLELLGAETDVVYSGPEAIERMATYRPSVILLDLGMPGMDGHEVARRIRRRPEYRDVTLIAMTGWGQEQDRRRTRAAGFDHHLTKPADVDVLGSLLYSLGASKRDPLTAPV
jgi:signal transduction histidine kinase/ActR/RegA family two-component response regulator